MELKMACTALINDITTSINDNINAGIEKAEIRGISLSLSTKQQRRTTMMPGRTVSQPITGTGELKLADDDNNNHNNNNGQFFTEADRKHYTSQSSLGRSQTDSNITTVTILSNLPTARNVLRKAASQNFDSTSSIPETHYESKAVSGNSVPEVDSIEAVDSPGPNILNKRKSWYGKLFGMTKNKSKSPLSASTRDETSTTTSIASGGFNQFQISSQSRAQSRQRKRSLSQSRPGTSKSRSGSVNGSTRKSTDIHRRASSELRSSSFSTTTNHQLSKAKNQNSSKTKPQTQTRGQVDTEPIIEGVVTSHVDTLRVLDEASEPVERPVTPPQKASHQSSQSRESKRVSLTNPPASRSSRASKRASVDYMRKKSIAELDRRNSLIFAHNLPVEIEADDTADGAKKLGDALTGFFKAKAIDETDTAKAQLEGTEKKKDQGRRGSVSIGIDTARAQLEGTEAKKDSNRRASVSIGIDTARAQLEGTEKPNVRTRRSSVSVRIDEDSPNSKAQEDRMVQIRARRLSSSVRASQALNRRESDLEVTTEGVVDPQTRAARRRSSHESQSRLSQNFQDYNLRQASLDHGDRQDSDEFDEPPERNDSAPSMKSPIYELQPSSNIDSESDKDEAPPIRRRSSQKDYLNMKFGAFGEISLGSIIEVDARGK